jgi:hypothetical protein
MRLHLVLVRYAQNWSSAMVKRTIDILPNSSLIRSYNSVRQRNNTVPQDLVRANFHAHSNHHSQDMDRNKMVKQEAKNSISKTPRTPEAMERRKIMAVVSHLRVQVAPLSQTSI